MVSIQETLELNFNAYVNTKEGPPTPTQVFSCGFQKSVFSAVPPALSLSLLLIMSPWFFPNYRAANYLL